MQLVESVLYARLGMLTRSVRGADIATTRAWYDLSTRQLLLRRTSSATRPAVIHELVRALVDQSFGLRRLRGLRARDRDRAVAAEAIVDGTAALASKLRAPAIRGMPLDRFLQLEDAAGLRPGRELAAQLRYLGGRRALATALRTFPQTTEQLLHIDKFLERERALPIHLATHVGDAQLTASETFGELEARDLLQAFGVRGAGVATAGWGGGRIALYVSATGGQTAALVLRWDTREDAAEWRDAFAQYLAAAFPGALARTCPPLDSCWVSTYDLASGTLGQTSVFASGPDSGDVAAALLTQS